MVEKYDCKSTRFNTWRQKNILRGQQKCKELTTSVIMFEMFEKRLSKVNVSNPRKSFYDSPG